MREQGRRGKVVREKMGNKNKKIEGCENQRGRKKVN